MYIYTNGHVIAKSLQKCFFLFFKHTTDLIFFFLLYVKERFGHSAKLIVSHTGMT